MVKKVGKLALLWFSLGFIYMLMEIGWRSVTGSRIFPDVLYMVPVGGLCGLLIGTINQIPGFYHMKVLYQSLMGTALTLFVEFCAGVYLNICRGLNIWDYSSVPGNLMGQICPPFALLWLFIMPLAIWTEDRLRWGFWEEGESYTLGSIYWEFFMDLMFWRRESE